MVAQGGSGNASGAGGRVEMVVGDEGFGRFAVRSLHGATVG